jgi:hypothetical protein
MNCVAGAGVRLVGIAAICWHVPNISGARLPTYSKKVCSAPSPWPLEKGGWASATGSRYVAILDGGTEIFLVSSAMPLVGPGEPPASNAWYGFVQN